VVVVAPVLNYSGTNDFDPLQFTDIFASELASFPGVSVVPVNLVMAALGRRGKAFVEGPADALALAREFGADATVVAAVTEYRPYDPAVVGLIAQWYGLDGSSGSSALTTRAAEAGWELSAAEQVRPTYQVQRVFNAAHEQVQKEVKEFAATRPGHESVYGWKRYLQSQELYVRYCCWSLIRTMQETIRQGRTDALPAQVSP
jgi:hypothetical protein